MRPPKGHRAVPIEEAVPGDVLWCPRAIGQLAMDDLERIYRQAVAAGEEAHVFRPLRVGAIKTPISSLVRDDRRQRPFLESPPGSFS